MLKPEDILSLKDSKNLLAFSGGADSTALFFLLLDAQIPFDIAIVDYGVRAQSKAEVAYAQELAQEYKKECFIHQADSIQSNFEATARKIRYTFFEDLIHEHGYETLLTAHHLGDRLEWFLMQLCKGAGCAELNSMQSITKKEHYTLMRPLLHVSKKELKNYLHVRQIRWYEDATNEDQSIKRNAFRHLHVNPLLQDYKEAIAKSFEYMDADTKELIQEVQILHVKEFYYFKRTYHQKSDIYHIDKILKSLGVMISAQVRKELSQSCESVISRKYVVAQEQNYIFITPYIRDIKMDKTFKERCRKANVTNKLRPYLFLNQDIFERYLTL